MTQKAIKSPALVIVALLLLSALPVRAQFCSLSSATLTCSDLKEVTVLKSFLEKTREKSLLQVKIACDNILDPILTVSMISPTINFLPFLLDCLTSSPNFTTC